eukprot:113763-Chlamydomonas_euryale.AAC.1
MLQKYKKYVHGEANDKDTLTIPELTHRLRGVKHRKKIRFTPVVRSEHDSPLASPSANRQQSEYGLVEEDISPHVSQ